MDSAVLSHILIGAFLGLMALTAATYIFRVKPAEMFGHPGPWCLFVGSGACIGYLCEAGLHGDYLWTHIGDGVIGMLTLALLTVALSVIRGRSWKSLFKKVWARAIVVVGGAFLGLHYPIIPLVANSLSA